MDHLSAAGSARVASRLMLSSALALRTDSHDPTDVLQRSFLLHSCLLAAFHQQGEGQPWQDYVVNKPLWDADGGEEMPVSYLDSICIHLPIYRWRI